MIVMIKLFIGHPDKHINKYNILVTTKITIDGCLLIYEIIVPINKNIFKYFSFFLLNVNFDQKIIIINILIIILI